MLQVRKLFPSARNLEMTWHSIVKIQQSLYREVRSTLSKLLPWTECMSDATAQPLCVQLRLPPLMPSRLLKCRRRGWTPSGRTRRRRCQTSSWRAATRSRTTSTPWRAPRCRAASAPAPYWRPHHSWQPRAAHHSPAVPTAVWTAPRCQAAGVQVPMLESALQLAAGHRDAV